jgi:hypothetical protein
MCKKVREEDTGMENEKHYESYLMPYDEAIKCVFGQEIPVLNYVWACWLKTKEERAKLLEKEPKGPAAQQGTWICLSYSGMVLSKSHFIAHAEPENKNEEPGQ